MNYQGKACSSGIVVLAEAKGYSKPRDIVVF
jgi:hypothetical protein